MTKPEPCATCDYKYGANFHVCLEPTPEPEVFKAAMRKHIQGLTYVPSVERREAWSAGQQRRHARNRIANGPRNRRIIDRYKNEKVGMKELAKDFGIGYQTVSNILKEAANVGEITIRKPGGNIRHGAK